MAKASENLYPYVHLVPAAPPASPAAGSQRLFLDSGDSDKLKRMDSSGAVTNIGGGGSGGAAIRYADTIASDFTSTTNDTYVTVTGLTLSLTPSANGLLMLNSRLRCKLSVAGNLYLKAVISPSPAVAPSEIGATFETVTSGKLRTLALVGAWDVAASTAYTVTVQFFQTGGGTFTLSSTSPDSELVGVFLPT
jgi:hypothetical protein